MRITMLTFTLNILLNQPLNQFEFYILNIYNDKYFLSFLKVNIKFFYWNILWISNFFIFFYLIWLINYFFVIFEKKRGLKLILNTVLQFLLENFIYKFVLKEVVDQNSKNGLEFWLYIVNLFFFILFSNLIGSLPYSFTITSHIILTFLLGSSTLIGLTIIGFIKQKKEFLNLFVPKGVPDVLLPLLIFIETVSYIARGFSLAIRLFANIMSGHSLLHILMFFASKILMKNFLVAILILFLISSIYLLELGIAFLQAYVFTVLSSIYLKDSFHAGH